MARSWPKLVKVGQLLWDAYQPKTKVFQTDCGELQARGTRRSYVNPSAIE
jgi:hypothetical protein